MQPTQYLAPKIRRSEILKPETKRPKGRPRLAPVQGPTRRKARPATGLYPGVCRTALAAKLGMHRVSITRILNGTARASDETLEKMAGALGLASGAILGVELSKKRS